MQSRREGIALAMVVLLMLVMGSIAAGAAVLGSNTYLMTQYKERQGVLATIADAGVEQVRARMNGDTSLYPDTLYTTIENGVTVTDAAGAVIPNVRRWTYAGPIGQTSGQYGVFGTVVSVAQATNGDRVIRRLEVTQESFAKYAYFTNTEGAIQFGGGDQLFGPVHSNDNINIHPTGVTFNGPVTTAGIINSAGSAVFRQGYLINQPIIPMPGGADLNRLRAFATSGGLAFVGNTLGGPGQATMRMEFVNVDLNSDGDATDDDEGFMRIWVATAGAGQNGIDFVTAHVPGAGIASSRNCGHIGLAGQPHAGLFRSAAAHPIAPSGETWDVALNAGNRRCYLGGSDQLYGAFTVTDPNGLGAWRIYPGVPDPRMAVAGLAFRADRAYLYPLSRNLNANFKGVIFVDGKVAVSGTVRSRITIAATSNIVIPDDLNYSINPGAGGCLDIVGIFSGTDVVVADNTINGPKVTTGGNYRSFDDTPDEFVQGVILALNTFTVENYANAPDNSGAGEACGATAWGRGCLFLTGGVIQRTRGAVATSGGTGNLKRYSWDPCGLSDPPPYFPTNGHFARLRLLEIDPTGFNIGNLFRLLSPP